MADLSGVPRVPPGTIARAHLDAVLDAGAPLCVLRGPGGTGKTTLLARWVRSLPGDHPVVWLTVDPETASRAGFWVRVLTRLNAAGILDDAALHGATAAIADAVDQLPAVLTRVFEGAPPVLLVLDDFAAAGEFWDGVCRDLVALVRQIGTVRVAVAGRRPTSLEGPSTGLTIEARVLDAAALAATDDDVRALLAAAGFMPDDAAVVDLVTRMPARSIRELRYAIELLARQSAAAPHRAGSPDRMVRAEQPAASTVPARSAPLAAVPSPDTLSPSVPLTPSDIAASMPTAVRRDLGARLRDRDATDFLGALALAPYGDRALAQALAETLNRGHRPGQNGTARTGNPVADPASNPGSGRRRQPQDGVQALTTLEAEGLGHWVDAPGGARFELSAPARAVAAARFAAAHPRAAAEVLTVVAHWLVSHRDDVGGAIEHALRAGDLDLADSLVPRARPLPSDVCRRIDAALGAVPVAQVRAYPFLALVHGAYLFSRPEPRPRAREFLRAVAQGPPHGGRGRSHPERLAVYGLEAMVWRLHGNRGRMLDRARRALREVTVSRDESSPEPHGNLDALAVLVLDQVALSLLMGDDVAAARRAYDVLDTIAREHGWANGWGVAAGGRALLAMLDGRMGDLRAELADARWSGDEDAGVAVAPGLAADGERGWLRAITAAWAHLDEGDPEAALARLRPLDELTGTFEQWELHADVGALAELMAGRPADARARLAHARRTRAGPATLPSARARLIAVQATVELAAGTGRGMPRRGVHGAAAAVDLALRAYTAAVHRSADDAVALLAQAQAATVTPLHHALTAIAGIVVATRTDAALEVDQFASELAAVVAAAGLHWPLMLLGPGERTAVLAALASDGARSVTRQALSTVPPAVGEGLWTQAQVPRLTPGEVTALHQLARTAARAEIAAALHVSINTVKAQLGSLYAKLGVRSREDALTRAVALGLLVIPDGWDTDRSERPDQPERAEVSDVPR